MTQLLNNEAAIDESEDEPSGEESEVEENSEEASASTQEGKRKFSQVSDEGEVPDSSKKPKTETEAPKRIRPPTAAELNRLRETENLFHSNLFRLQIEETLKESKPKDAVLDKTKSWLKQLKTILWNIEETDPTKVSELSWLKEKKIRPPIKLNAVELEEEFAFKKPSKIEVVGSYSLGYFLGSTIAIDLAVQIPQIIFGKKDHQNERYHRKRSLYLCHIANALLSNSTIVNEDMHFTLQNYNFTKPVLVVKPCGSLGNKITVYIHCVVSMSMCKPTKLAPNRNNVKSSWFLDKEVNEENEPATPFYNSSILEDMVTLSNEILRKKIFTENPKFKDAMSLLKIWLRQRKLNEGVGSFSNYMMSMFLVYLFQIRRLNKFMSSYQILRNVWIVLSQANWTTEGISLQPAVKSEPEGPSVPSISDFHAAFEVVFIDLTGLHNICSSLSKTVYLKVKCESALALETLDNSSVNSFQSLFMVPISFLQHYDNVIHFRDLSFMRSVIRKHSPQEKQLDSTKNVIRQFTSLIISLVENGLGDRVSQIGIQTHPAPLKWSIKSKPSSIQDSISVLVGLMLNSETAFSVLQKGPDANVPEAKGFRQFWGSKSELRRFRDGTVCEATIWAEDNAPLKEKRITTQHMLTYLLDFKLNLKMPQYQYVSNQTENFLDNNQFIPHGFKYGTGEEACLQVMSAFDQLGKQLRSLKNLPLDISTLVGTSPVFRYADVFPPLAQTLSPNPAVTTVNEGCVIFNGLELNKCTNYIPAIDGVIHLIGSGKWPDDIAAVRRIKAAFYVKLAELLRVVHRLVCQPYPEYLSVIKDGFVFRLKIFYSGEVTLLKRRRNEEDLIEYHDTEESLELERNLVHLPQITSALHGLHLKYPSFGPACALAKRWLNSQLLDDFHFPSIIAELLVASSYTSPHPHSPAFNPQTVFLRFLALLSQTDWNTEPLVVNFNSEMPANVVVELEKKFREERDSFPPLVIFTPYDESGTVWSKDSPSPVIFIRTVKLASQALQKFETNLLMMDASLEVAGLFVPPLDAYNIVIRLKVSMLPRQWYAIDAPTNTSKHQLQAPNSSKLPISDFDPAQCFLKELRENYDEFALFFHDTYGGSVIGVLLKPTVLESCEFKAKFFNGRCPSGDKQNSSLTFNVDALIEDFKTISSGLVESVTLQK
nr:PREDICTED: nucleolar protein 6 [Bemisia tabaci]